METVTATSSPTITFPSSNLSSTNILKKYSKSTVTLISRKGINRPIKTTAISDVSASANPAEAEVTWQIIVGAIAGITPFVVAGIEFSKRIEGFSHGSHGKGFSLAEISHYHSILLLENPAQKLYCPL
ncbi:hypothetical protein HS088_TW21G00600 [Tripterygium wilfordii]|uniref:Uncharacterized protein n=1 Tax=Tripterygium wilfordii TaxID=458696 RepID=A0A7J7C2W5_TRIWF|nr:hypothetical protein HS088_TW21G00600 [Tripterygium wilfordii]